jgi:hypothetical protein
MRFTRLIAGLTTAGLLGLAPVAISSPAEATDNLTTTSTVETYSTLPITVGDEITLSAKVTGSDGLTALDGPVALQVYTPKNPVWTTVATDEGGYASFQVKPSTNSAYKIVYGGYAATSTYEDNYAPSESVPLEVGVKRKAVFKTPGLFLVGKVKPDFKHKLVVLKRKQGKKYVAWKKVRTNKLGVFRVKAPNKRGFKFSVTIPADKKYVGFTDYYQVY